jgi:hypothetical protein
VAAIFGVGHFAAATDTGDKFFQRSRSGPKRISIDIPVGKIDRDSGKIFAPQPNIAALLAFFLAGRVVHTKLGKFFFQIIHDWSPFLLSRLVITKREQA